MAKSSTMCFIAATCDTIVCVPRFQRLDVRAVEISAASFIASRSAESWIGVSGFLISCARRRATSAHAASRCACTQLRDVVEDHDVAREPARRAAGCRASAASATAPTLTSASVATVRRAPPRKPRRRVRRTTPAPATRVPHSASAMPSSSASGCCRITAALGLRCAGDSASSKASTPAERLARMLSR